MTRSVSVALGAIAVCALTQAQVTSGKITGVVRDQTNLPVQAAAIQVTNLGTRETWRAVSNESGVYVVSPLPVGDYTLSVRKDGFKVSNSERLRIDAVSFLTVDVALEIGSTVEHVTVEGRPALIDTEERDVGNSRYAIQLEELPLPVRETQTLVGQTAGVPYGVQSTVGGSWKDEGRTAMQIVADGVSVNPFQSEAWPSIGGIGRRADLTIPGVESLTEVKLTASGGSAEYMEPTQVIMATKGGSNELHGSAYEFYSSGGLGDRRWENTQRSSYVRHQPGATVGGPIKKNKVFFFGGYEAYRYVQEVESPARYPTAAEASGNLGDMLQRTTSSGAPAPVNLFDPLAGPGQLFPNDVIPASRISPVSSALLQLIQPGPSPIGNLSNYNVYFNKPQYDNSDKYDARVDYNISDRDRLFARTTIARLNQQFAYNDDVPGVYGMSGKAEWNHAAAASWTRIWNPGTISVAQFTFRNMPFNNTMSSEGKTTFSVPIAGLTPDPSSAYAGPPGVSIGSNALGIGGPPPQVTGQTANTNLFNRSLGQKSSDYDFTFDPTLTKIVGNHSFKAGFSFLRGYKTKWPAAAPYGTYTTASDFNNASSTVSATGDAFADFLLGYPSTTSVAVGPPQANGGQLTKTNYSAFLQDDWKVTERLTLNLGIRYDKLGFFYETDEKGSVGSFALGKIVIQDGSQSLIQALYQPFSSQFVTASQAGLPNTFVKPNNLDFVPRLGFAYRLTPTLVLRGGFGIYNVDITINDFSEYGQPPFALVYNLSRAQLLSAGANVNSIFTFQNPTAGGSGAGAQAALSSFPTPTPRYPTEKAYTYSLTLEKDFGHQYGVRLSYLGNDGRNLSRVVEVNACAPGPTQCTARAATDPTAQRWPQFSTTFGDQAADGKSEFNSFEVEVHKRFSGGLLLDVNYAYARLFDLADATDPVTNPLAHYDWGPVTDQPPQVFHWNHVYELPFGKGRRYGSSMRGVANAIAGGWSLSGEGTWQAGPYLAITTGVGQSPTGAQTNRAELVGNPNLSPSGRSQYEWFNTAAFAQPPLVSPGAKSATYMFGNSPMGVVRGPRFYDYDAMMQKSFAVRERVTMNFRVQALNVLNHPALASPDTVISDGTFGQIRSSYASYNAAYGPRSIELSLRVKF